MYFLYLYCNLKIVAKSPTEGDTKKNPLQGTDLVILNEILFAQFYKIFVK
jgi:hypothetical protein